MVVLLNLVEFLMLNDCFLNKRVVSAASQLWYQLGRKVLEITLNCLNFLRLCF